MIQKLLSLLSGFGLVSAYIAGLAGVFVVSSVGAPLAMAARMYLGDLEPETPTVDWPLWITLILGILPVPALVTRRWGLAAALSLPFAVLPYYQLYRLYLAAAPR